jgi:hypothetical protein
MATTNPLLDPENEILDLLQVLARHLPIHWLNEVAITIEEIGSDDPSTHHSRILSKIPQQSSRELVSQILVPCPRSSAYKAGNSIS